MTNKGSLDPTDLDRVPHSRSRGNICPSYTETEPRSELTGNRELFEVNIVKKGNNIQPEIRLYQFRK